ncbi:hypothetical protein ACHZ98_08280 [Streptomyces sp. MAR4 CNY-716]
MENARVTKVSDRELEGYVVQHGERYPGRHETKLFFNIRFDGTLRDSTAGYAPPGTWSRRTARTRRWIRPT